MIIDNWGLGAATNYNTVGPNRTNSRMQIREGLLRVALTDMDTFY